MNTHLLLFATLVVGTGCSTVQEAAISEPERQAVYATKDAINAGRFDLADQYSDSAVRMFPPPKRKIVILPILR